MLRNLVIILLAFIAVAKAQTFNHYSSSGKILLTSAVPTIAASGCGGSAASISNPNGTQAFVVVVGTSNTGACTITMPAASNGWVCDAQDKTTTNGNVFVTKESATASTSITLSNFTDTGSAHAWVDADNLLVKCTGY